MIAVLHSIKNPYQCTRQIVVITTAVHVIFLTQHKFFAETMAQLLAYVYMFEQLHWGYVIVHRAHMEF